MRLLRLTLFAFYNLLNGFWLRLNKVSFSGLTIHGFLFVYNKGTVTIGKGSRINSHRFKNIIGGDTRSTIVVKKNASLSIGSNFRMSNSAIYCAEKIVIGDNVMVGGSCRIWDTDFHPLNPKERTENPNEHYKTSPVTIGNDVFVGGFSIILKGVSIGDGSIIGAGSVVSRNVPAGEIWAGNPAAYIKKVQGHEH